MFINTDSLDIYSNSYKDNITHIHAVLWILRKEKCLIESKDATFMTTHLNYSGVTINTKENLINIDKDIARIILNWPVPTSFLELIRRIQSLTYLSKHLPRQREIANPLWN